MLPPDVLHEVREAVPPGLLPKRTAATAEVLRDDLVISVAARSEVETGSLDWREDGVVGARGKNHGGLAKRRVVLATHIEK